MEFDRWVYWAVGIAAIIYAGLALAVVSLAPGWRRQLRVLHATLADQRLTVAQRLALLRRDLAQADQAVQGAHFSYKQWRAGLRARLLALPLRAVEAGVFRALPARWRPYRSQIRAALQQAPKALLVVQQLRDRKRRA